MEAPSEFNQELRAYEQVAKLQRYRLAEDAEEEFDEDFVLRPCDLSLLDSPDAADRERFIGDLGASLEDTGFAILTGHGVAPALYAEAHRRTREFFECHPLEVKQRYRARRQGSVNQGYFPMRETTVIHPDLVEGWVFCRRAFDLEGDSNWDEADFWPSPGWEAFFRQIVLAHERLIHPIMRSILSLSGRGPCALRRAPHRHQLRLPAELLPADDRRSRRDDRKDARPRGRGPLHHPPRRRDRGTPAPPPEDDEVGAGRRAAGRHRPEHRDYMQRITNNRLPSTTHRVSAPRDPAARAQPRTSFPMAIYVWEDEILEVLPNQGAPLYPPVRAEDFHTRITSKYYGDSYHATGEEGAVSRRVR